MSAVIACHWSYALVRSACAEQVTKGRSMVRLGLFVSSYSALFAILALRFDPPLAWVSWALSATGLGAALWILSAESAKAFGSFEIAKVEDQGAEVIGYLASYLLPFVVLGQPSDRDVASYALFLLVSALVYIASDLIQINPVFYLLRRRVAKVTTTKGWTAFLITRDVPIRNETILATTLARGVLVRANCDRTPP